MQFGIRTLAVVVFFAAVLMAIATRKTHVLNAGSLNSFAHSIGRVAGFSLTVCKAGNEPRVLLIDHDPSSATRPTWHHVSLFSLANSTKTTAQIKIYPNCGAHVIRDGKVLVFYKTQNLNLKAFSLEAEDIQKHFYPTGDWKNVEALCRFIASEASGTFTLPQNADTNTSGGTRK